MINIPKKQKSVFQLTYAINPSQKSGLRSVMHIQFKQNRQMVAISSFIPHAVIHTERSSATILVVLLQEKRKVNDACLGITGPYITFSQQVPIYYNLVQYSPLTAITVRTSFPIRLYNAFFSIVSPGLEAASTSDIDLFCG